MVTAKCLQTTNDVMGKIRPSTVLCRIRTDGEKGDRVDALGLDDHGAFNRSHGNLLFRSNPECNHHFFKPTRHEFKKSKFRGHQAVTLAPWPMHRRPFRDAIRPLPGKQTPMLRACGQVNSIAL